MAGGINPIGNLRGKVNANGALVVTLDGGQASATVFLAGDGSAAAPSYSFTSDTDTGFWRSGSGTVEFASNGTSAIVFGAGPMVGANGTFRWASTSDPSGGTADVILARVAAGHAANTTGLLLTKLTNTAITTDGNVTYSAAQVLGGLITRSGITTNRVDAFPTAAAMVAALPGAVVGTAGRLIVNNNDDASTITVNGASTGVTYEGAATALAAGDAWIFEWMLTNVTASSEAMTVYQLAK